MNLKQALKITLLIVILVEEIKSVETNQRFLPEDSNGISDTTKESMKDTSQKYFD
ncbi:hypothetical protein OXR01_13550 [Staphylococcus gallinarum]|uniref:hypothetical protein n=1 Tax=Staphylococcus gallinarum TaxID=1293 RepID=UPI0022807BDD|nr:hypothetical protein [Staphylococcus gallinarum]MDN6414915.1 hypothetical protein [Staphylococcus gallinarum]